MDTQTMTFPVDTVELRGKVQEMYTKVAETPDAGFHFEMGRGLALRLGYTEHELNLVPEDAVRSFAGVGYHFDLAGLSQGESVLDLGSGSGMDSFIAGNYVGSTGRVEGIDMTAAQLEKSRRLGAVAFPHVHFTEGLIERLPFRDGSFDAVISNGVINLAADKERVFREAARVLNSGGRLAISDILTEKQLKESIVCDTTLWASCIGGAAQEDAYRALIEDAGFSVQTMRANPQYHFLSKSAQSASRTYGVKSVSVLAIKR